jgi:hypothetical protein
VRRFSIAGSSIGVAHGAVALAGGVQTLFASIRGAAGTLRHYSASADVLVYADGAVWAASSDGSVWKIDPVGNDCRAREAAPVLGDLTVGGGSVWVSILGENKFYELERG